MANENKNTNELVSTDDDPTAELEIPNFEDDYTAGHELEEDADTFRAHDEQVDGSEDHVSTLQLQSDLRSRKKTIDRLQFDIEQLHARWVGLEAEIKARESQTVQLNEEAAELKDVVDRNEDLLKERDQEIKTLTSEFRQRNDEYRTLEREAGDLQDEMKDAEEKIANASVERAEAAEILLKLNRSEELTSTLQIQTDELNDVVVQQKIEIDREEKSLKEREEKIVALESEIEHRNDEIRALEREASDLRGTLQEAEGKVATATVERTEAAEVLLKLKSSEELADTLQFRTDELNDVVARQENTIGQEEKSVKEREREIEALESDVRQKDEEHQTLLIELDSLNKTLSKAEETAGTVSIERAAAAQLLDKLHRSDEYADSIRRKLQDRIESSAKLEGALSNLEQSLQEVTQEKDGLSGQLLETETKVQDLQAKLERLESEHENEIRTLRFELGEAQDTAVEAEGLTSQLVSDLMGARGSNDDLERALLDSEEESRSRVEKLTKQVEKLSKSASQYEDKLSTKSEAISALLGELAIKSTQLESIDKIEGVIQDIGDRMSERFADSQKSDLDDNSDRNLRRENNHKHASNERVTRVLVGTVDGQILRFPLFKDRLTVGRAEDNDIQVSASYVSRRHAVVQTDGDATRIIDWGSKNGVYVNSERVKEHFLSQGDIVTIGDARFRYEERKKRDS